VPEDFVRIFTDEHGTYGHCRALDEVHEFWRLFFQIWETLPAEARLALVQTPGGQDEYPFWDEILVALLQSSYPTLAEGGIQIVMDMWVPLQAIWEEHPKTFSLLWHCGGFRSDDPVIRERCLQLWRHLPQNVKNAILADGGNEPFFDFLLFGRDDPTGEKREVGTEMLLDVWPHIDQSFLKSLFARSYGGGLMAKQRELLGLEPYLDEDATEILKDPARGEVQ
jgi:hypothetical protein